MCQEEVWRDSEERAYHHGAEDVTVSLECYASIYVCVSMFCMSVTLGAKGVLVGCPNKIMSKKGA